MSVSRVYRTATKQQHDYNGSSRKSSGDNNDGSSSNNSNICTAASCSSIGYIGRQTKRFVADTPSQAAFRFERHYPQNTWDPTTKLH